jgi:alpha-2-macroglobulin
MIHVLPKGIKEAEGVFLSLRNDTTFTINPKQGTVKLYAQADLLDVLLEEIESVKSYSYDCNEQLASKLKVLLAEKKIKQFKKEEFLHESQVRRIINNLQKNQNKDGSWSWWEQGDGFTWITIYVTTVLEAATKEGFQVRFDRQGAINFIQKDLFNTEFLDRIDPFIFLANHNIKVDSKPLLDSISRYKNLSVYTQLKLLTLEQVLGKHSKIEWLDSLKKETIKGNYYWGETATNLFDNDIQCTLLGYKLKEAYNASDDELSRIRNFFLEKRRRSWRNTFESAKIIDTILPTLLQSSQRNETTWLSLTGGANLKVVKFPFELETKTIEPITVSKVGSSPVYFTAYHEFWNNAPEKSDKDFIVETRFEDNLQTLQAGKPIKLYVNLTVKKDAEYIMIDVPIPSGCSYENKPQSRKNGEVHRESYSYKTSIFCQALKQGYYQYEISLIPRYKGSYTLNPARAELMYFPVIHGNETVKRVEIK